MDLLKVTLPLLLATGLTVAASEWAAGPVAEIAVSDRANAQASLAATGQFAAMAWGASTQDSVTDIYVTTSRDGGRTSRLTEADSSHALAGGVCYCCKTAIASDAAGGVYAAWRHVYDGNVRDIPFIKSADGGRTFGAPVRVSDDNWVLDGCPENGPSLTVDEKGRIHVVWPTLVSADRQGRACFARSDWRSSGEQSRDVC
jgi:hypothetical protein